MYTDVVGYSKLTGDNQKLALVILEEHNEILKKYTNEYLGNIVKLTGDGLCALFDKPVNAIKSAINIQIALDRRNQLNTRERQIQILKWTYFSFGYTGYVARRWECPFYFLKLNDTVAV